jgi:hypothetical protein
MFWAETTGSPDARQPPEQNEFVPGITISVNIQINRTVSFFYGSSIAVGFWNY